MSRDVHAPAATVSPWRCLLVWVGVTAAAGPLVACLTPAVLALPGTVSGRPGGGAVDQALESLAALALLGCSGWVWLVASATVVEGWRRGTVRLAGGVVRRLVLLGCGAAVVAGVGAPATAVDGSAPGRSEPGLLAGLRLPERASSPLSGPRHGVAAAAGSSVARGLPRDVVVRRGDSLWRIAEQALPAGADAEEIDAAWRRLHARNREVVGADPDLILPGQHLVVPRADVGTTDPTHRE